MSLLRSLRNLGRIGDQASRHAERRIWRLQKHGKQPAMATELKQLVFLGWPGSGKGTYSTRLAQLLRVPHISIGDLLRQGAVSGAHAQAMKEGKLLPDAIILELLSARLRSGLSAGEDGFILDGFPRTRQQAEILDQLTRIDRVVNLHMREDVLVAKCLGRRTCSQCNKSFNLTNVDVEGVNGGPRIQMPPVLPPPGCESKMVIREDDREEVVRTRLRVYHQESEPVEDYYRRQGKLVEVYNEGSIADIWSSLLAELNLEREATEEAIGYRSAGSCKFGAG